MKHPPRPRIEDYLDVTPRLMLVKIHGRFEPQQDAAMTPHQVLVEMRGAIAATELYLARLKGAALDLEWWQEKTK